MTSPSLPFPQARRLGLLILPADSRSPSRAWLRGDASPLVVSDLQRLAGPDCVPEILDAAAFDARLGEIYGSGSLDAEAVSATLEGGDAPEMAEAAELLDSSDDAPVIAFINRLIADAARAGASDVHIEPYEAMILVRMRVDGVLREVVRLPARVAPMIVSRIKVMARLDIAERRLPQDGRISATRGGKALDVRVSTLPARGGERVVLRLLDRDQANIGLTELGMPAPVLERTQEALRQPNGIILVTGPTGSGKTTTLYAALRLLNDGARNILTVEDPVEYAIDGIGQTQVNMKVGMSFAAGLRAILRQDPDVVMIGEIRDRETADIAIQAALTGHLVLSTVHTNDAVGAIVRLRDLGIEPFLLASSMRMVLAQRLVRRLCSECKIPARAEPALARQLGLAADSVVHQSQGCPACHHTGYQGRIGVFEAVTVDEGLRRLILSGADEDALAAHAQASCEPLHRAAARLVADGRTSAEEALRMTRAEAAADA